jgi:putative addiction module component (TIGR02574 family)
MEGWGKQMDMTSVLQEVDTWSPEQRIKLVEEVWNRLIDEGHEPNLTEAQRQELDRRIADADANPGEIFSPEDVRRYARKRR